MVAQRVRLSAGSGAGGVVGGGGDAVVVVVCGTGSNQWIALSGPRQSK